MFPSPVQSESSTECIQTVLRQHAVVQFTCLFAKLLLGKQGLSQ